jgi:menaquinone-dependent protoporphyrinogen oxidase
VLPISTVGDASRYTAFVVGSSVYYGSWLKEATAFVRRNQALLASRPVWLFSSGPISADSADAEGRDLLDASVPKEIGEFEQTIHPYEHRVFFGKLDKSRLGFIDRLVTSVPAFSAPEGDSRNWAEVEAWAASIAAWSHDHALPATSLIEARTS